MEEYNIVAQMWLNMYVWLNVLKWSMDNLYGHKFHYVV